MVAPDERVLVETLDGLRLSVRTGGDGPPLLLLHGFTGSADAWPADVWTGLTRRWRVIAPDLIGHGRSARPHDAGRYALDRVLDDLARVHDALADRPAGWIGYSMGGRIALAAAARGSAPMAALVLESASPGIADAAERRVRRASDEARATALEAEGIEPFVDAWMAQPLFESQRDLPAAVVRAERERRRDQDAGALAACLRGLGTGSQPSLWDALPGIAVPTLLVTGERDAKFTALAAEMARALPRVRHARIGGAGHAIHLERPRAWLDAAEAFLDPLRAGSP